MKPTDEGLYVYLVVLWIAFYGMVGFRSHELITRRSKQLGAIVFVALVIDSAIRA